MALSPPDKPWADARWPILFSGIAAFVILLAYDVRFGVAAGILLLVLGLAWQLAAMWFGFGFRSKSSPVSCVAERYEEQLKRRLVAEARARDSSASVRSRPQKTAD